MSTVVNLANYRRKTRKAYLDKHGARLDRFVEKFVKLNIDVDFRQLAEDYQACRQDGQHLSWDYVYFREVLAEALDAAFGKALYQLLLAQPWFDRHLITQDEVIDRCLSSYVLSGCEYALIP